MPSKDTTVTPKESRRSWPHIEYRAEGIAFYRDMASLTTQLNALGKDGWEVLEIQWQNGNEHALVLMQRAALDD